MAAKNPIDPKEMSKNRFSDLSEHELLQVLLDFEVYTVKGTILEPGLLADIRDYYCEQFDARGVLLMEQDLLLVCSHRLCTILEEKERQNFHKVYNQKKNGPSGR